ncbi:MAG: prolipoprotein diacylglyceryl transferase [Candidatus Woesearchaeota archaeon]
MNDQICLDTSFLDFNFFGILLPIAGTMFIIGIVAFIISYISQIKKYNLEKKHVIASLIHFGFFGLLGIHWFTIFFVSKDYSNLFSVFGGNDSAGIMLGLVAYLIYMKYYKLDIKKYFDALALPIIIMGTVLRVACALILDEIGFATTLPWGIYYFGEFRHPIGWYYLIVSSLILLVIFYLSKKNLKSGNLFLSMALLYSSTRILLDFLREFPSHDYFGLSIHQISYLLLFIVCFVLLIVNNRKNFISSKLKKSINAKTKSKTGKKAKN